MPNLEPNHLFGIFDSQANTFYYIPTDMLAALSDDSPWSMFKIEN